MILKTRTIKRWLITLQRIVMNLDMLPKIMNTAWKLYVVKKPVVKQAGIMLSYECPCLCTFCFADNIRKSSRPELSIDEIEKLIEDFARLGTLSICLTGGEPLVYKDVLKIIEMADMIKEKDPELKVSLVCNDNICSKSIKLLIDNNIEIIH